MVKADNFTLKKDAAKPGSTPDGKIMVKALYLSVDPYMRGRMNEGKSYIPPWPLNESPTGFIAAEVVESKADGFAKGDIVAGSGSWSEFQVLETKDLMKCDCSDGTSPAKFLSVLGIYALSGYFPVDDIGKPKEGEVVFVSGASGAIGSIAAQIFLIKGCTVIGSAGSAEKVAYLKELGLQHAFNYKEGNTADALKAAAPGGIDIYWDNVGGATLDAALGAIKEGGRVITCGSISNYNTPADQRYTLKNEGLVAERKVTRKGFLLYQYAKDFGSGLAQMKAWHKDGKMKLRETIFDGVEKVSEAFVGVFKGANIGKMLIKVA